eukprot:scaffold22696_cov118-Cylindrotheca_fusiformis.AAC.2
MAGTTIDNSPQDDGFFQVQTSSSGKKLKQVYIGGLPKNLPDLEQHLVDWMKERIPDLTIGAIKINEGGKNPHAIVDCGTQGNLVISKLHQQTFKGRRLTVQREKRNKNSSKSGSSKNNAKQQFGGWAKPKTEFTQIPVEEATNSIQAVVEEEIKAAEEAGEDTMNVALASTAAATFLAAMNGFSNPQEEVVDDGVEESEGKPPADDGFQLKDMSELLSDFGEADPNWKKQSVDVAAADQQETASRLAPKGKAPIHIIITSFGFIHGAPKRQEGWSHSQPLGVIDCRELFASVPQHLEWRTGLTGLIKRVLIQENRDNDIQQHARKVIANQVWDCLLEAQEAGHGYASPLEVTIYVGSELGKHRSVVLCEWAAIAIRKKLRQNEKNCIHQPVSVETNHRDVDRQKSSTKDEKRQKKVPEFGADW